MLICMGKTPRPVKIKIKHPGPFPCRRLQGGAFWAPRFYRFTLTYTQSRPRPTSERSNPLKGIKWGMGHLGRRYSGVFLIISNIPMSPCQAPQVVLLFKLSPMRLPHSLCSRCLPSHCTTLLRLPPLHHPSSMGPPSLTVTPPPPPPTTYQTHPKLQFL